MKVTFDRSCPLLSRYSVNANLTIESKEDIISELKLYKRAGGGTLCDLTSIGLRYASGTCLASPDS